VENELLNIGHELKRCREAKGLTVEQLADKTKISVKFVQNLEQGQYQFLPDVYIRAFLKTLALEVGLDQEVILRQYQHALQKPAEPKVEAVKKIPEESRKPAPGLRMQSLRLMSKSQPIVKAIEKTIAEPPPFFTDLKMNSKTTGAMTAGVLGLIILIFIFFALPKKENRTTVDETDRQVSLTSAEAEPESPVMPSEESVLTIKAVQNTWLRIVFDDSIADEVTFSPGDIRSWKSHSKFYLRIGNVGGVEMVLNGKNLGAPGQGPQIANVVVDQQGFSTITAAELPAAMNVTLKP